MKKALILHGTCESDEFFNSRYPSPSNAHWLPWLQQRFLRNGFLCQNPELPYPYQPVYEEWKKTFEQFTPQTQDYIVGHSAGAGFILKYLQTQNLQLEKLILVAPWLDPQHLDGEFMKTDLNPQALKDTKEIHLLCSDDDEEDIQISKKRILEAYPQIIYHQFLNLGHFTGIRSRTTFEELWNICRP